MIKKILLIFALVLPVTCLADEMAVAAMPIDGYSGNRCKVFIPQYRAGSSVMYTGSCGWAGLSGTGAYVQTWNHGNHIRIVRGQFASGQIQSFAKITYINMVKKTVETYEQNSYTTQNFNEHHLDDILADARQSGLRLGNTPMAYIKLANYIDMRE
jgi:hypothetical protein